MLQIYATADGAEKGRTRINPEFVGAQWKVYFAFGVEENVSYKEL
jgi:hypothetical protein